MINAVALAAGGLEGYLRVTASQKSKLYEGIETVPEIADTYFKHVFLEKHATKDAWNNANYDPQLGWDYQIAASRIRGPRKTGPKPAGTFRVITLGDSFTWGIEVGEDEHFPHYLEKILQGRRAAEVFNMGVGSYGIDQTVLKYERHGQALRPGGNGDFEETDRLAEYLLTRLKSELDRTGTKLLVVQIPRGNAFENGDTLSKAKSEPRTARLKALYEKLKIPTVDLLDALPAKHETAAIYREHYIHRPDGSIGHFTPRGNAEVAKIIAEALKEKGMLTGGNEKSRQQNPPADSLPKGRGRGIFISRGMPRLLVRARPARSGSPLGDGENLLRDADESLPLLGAPVGLNPELDRPVARSAPAGGDRDPVGLAYRAPRAGARHLHGEAARGASGMQKLADRRQ